MRDVIEERRPAALRSRDTLLARHSARHFEVYVSIENSGPRPFGVRYHPKLFAARRNAHAPVIEQLLNPDNELTICSAPSSHFSRKLALESVDLGLFELDSVFVGRQRKFQDPGVVHWT